MVSILNDLIATCGDCVEGFGKAAKGAHSDALRDLFTDCARQHDDFAIQLSDRVRAAGGEPDTMGHYGGIQHRGWVDLETSIRPREDPELVDACVTGEQAAIKHYERSLARELPRDVRGLVERQLRSMREVIPRLRGFVHVRRAG